MSQSSSSEWKWGIAIFVLMGIAGAYCTAAITFTVNAFERHTKYVHERDSRWEPRMDKFEMSIDHIENHLHEQDKDAAKVKENQQIILNAIKKGQH